jgi:Mn2+/Fe2+ NRAMP family transporter
MAIMMSMAIKPEIMGKFTIHRKLQILGWMAVALMAVAVIAMFWTTVIG